MLMILKHIFVIMIYFYCNAIVHYSNDLFIILEYLNISHIHTNIVKNHSEYNTPHRSE